MTTNTATEIHSHTSYCLQSPHGDIEAEFIVRDYGPEKDFVAVIFWDVNKHSRQRVSLIWVMLEYLTGPKWNITPSKNPNFSHYRTKTSNGYFVFTAENANWEKFLLDQTHTSIVNARRLWNLLLENHWETFERPRGVW